jgi:hypothetical protein
VRVRRESEQTELEADIPEALASAGWHALMCEIHVLSSQFSSEEACALRYPMDTADAIASADAMVIGWCRHGFGLGPRDISRPQRWCLTAAEGDAD